jgi:MerR family mercuric resistance operon transcriptional regulator
LLDLSASDDRARARQLARSRVAALDEKIAELREAREALAGLATDCAKKRGGPCPILTAFDRGGPSQQRRGARDIRERPFPARLPLDQ